MKHRYETSERFSKSSLNKYVHLRDSKGKSKTRLDKPAEHYEAPPKRPARPGKKLLKSTPASSHNTNLWWIEW